MKKVIIDASPVADASKSGVGYYTEALLKSMDTYWPHDTKITGYYFNFLLRKRKRMPLTEHIHFHPIALVPGKLLALCRKLGFQPPLEIFLPRRADVAIFTNYVSLPTRKKKAVIIYDLGFLDHPEFVHEKNLHFLKKFCPPAIETADLIITISEFTKNRINHYFPNLKADMLVTPIPPQVSTKPSYTLSSHLKGIGIKKQAYFLYLGTIEPRKNIVNLLKAYSLLAEELQSKYALVLAGGKGWKDKEILSTLRTLRDSGCDIIQTGYVSDNERSALYANATCFVLPSAYEGFGMPLLEAMQFKTPVLASDIPVFKEVAGEAALYFDYTHPTAITVALEKISTDPTLRAHLAKLGTDQVNKISWKDNAELLYKHIELLVNK